MAEHSASLQHVLRLRARLRQGCALLVLAVILQNVTGSTIPSVILSAGAVLSVFSVTLVVLYGQTRVLFAMSRDGMLPPIF